MFMIEAESHSSLKGNFNIRIEMPEKVEFLGLELASEALSWLKVLRKAKKTLDEIERTKDQVLHRNIDELVKMYLYNQGKRLEKAVEIDFKKYTKDLNLKKDEVSKVIEAISNSQTILHLVNFQKNNFRLLTQFKLIGLFTQIYLNCIY